MFKRKKTDQQPSAPASPSQAPWTMERVGHPHQNITIRHHNTGASQVFSGDNMIGHFAGQNAERDARRHAIVHSIANYEYEGRP